MSVLTPDFLTHLTDNTANDSWEELLAPFRSVSAPPVSLHLAVLVQPYLDFILDGQKTIESRFSIRPIPPYRRVESGDIVLLKASGGPIVGAFFVALRTEPATARARSRWLSAAHRTDLS